MGAFLDLCARYGRVALVAGLVAGIGLGLIAPGVAEASRVVIAPMVVGLLFLAVLRLGPEGVRAGLRGVGRALAVTLALQLALPVAAALVVLAGGWQGAAALGIVLMLAAAPITGSPNIAIMSGGDPVPALRQLVLGTALLPVTVIPVFALVPAFGEPAQVAAIVLRLLAVIALAGGLALLLRLKGVVPGTDRALRRMDGLASLVLAVVVVAIMGAVGPALREGGAVWGLLALVLAVNLGLQAGTGLIARAAGARATIAPLGIVAGNRNVALFLSVLPAGLADELLLFIGLYQIPMYLTPLLMTRFYRRLAQPAEGRAAVSRSAPPRPRR
jgi:arsenite transporter